MDELLQRYRAVYERMKADPALRELEADIGDLNERLDALRHQHDQLQAEMYGVLDVIEAEMVALPGAPVLGVRS